jgi:hypothetical protein
MMKKLEITRDKLITEYGKGLVNHFDKTHDDGWLEELNTYNHEYFLEIQKYIPEGLEKKIYLPWFGCLFSGAADGWTEGYHSSFRGNWLDVPFPNADVLILHGNHNLGFGLGEDRYNWFDLFVMMNDLMWMQGRLWDISITSVDLNIKSDGKKIIYVGWSS